VCHTSARDLNAKEQLEDGLVNSKEVLHHVTVMAVLVRKHKPPAKPAARSALAEVPQPKLYHPAIVTKNSLVLICLFKGLVIAAA
jgi:hypothetical protein